MEFGITKQSKISSLRRGYVKIHKFLIKTPLFMPVGSVAAVKTVAPLELKKLGGQIVLGNTYHLHLRPGEKIIKKFGGLKKFMNWQGPILTDSGGYQVFSLGQNKTTNSELQTPDQSRAKSRSKLKIQNLINIKTNGVEFRSHLDGTKHFFTPEKVMQIQLDLGSDFILPLDVCPPANASKKEIKRAVELTLRWLERSGKYLEKKTANSRRRGVRRNSSHNKPVLLAIVQGGTYPDLREYCAKKMTEMNLPGYAVGGLAVGEEKRRMWSIVKQMDKILPKDKPRYLMGVGTPDDLIKATNLGMDMFDCVLPTRLARHGVIFAKKRHSLKTASCRSSKFKKLNLLNSKYKGDKQPLDPKCGCPACSAGFSKAYLHHLLKEREILGLHLTTLHNLYTYFDLMKDIRKNV